MPLWYNKDKRKNPITKGYESVCRYISILFPMKFHGKKIVEKKGGVLLETKNRGKNPRKYEKAHTRV